jgi:hypothetical protein
MTTYLVERYWPGVTLEAATDGAARAYGAAEAMTAEGIDVRMLWSSVMLADEAVLSFYEARSANAVEEVNRRAGLPVDRITSCVPVTSMLAGANRERGTT